MGGSPGKITTGISTETFGKETFYVASAQYLGVETKGTARTPGRALGFALEALSKHFIKKTIELAPSGDNRGWVALVVRGI